MYLQKRNKIFFVRNSTMFNYCTIFVNIFADILPRRFQIVINISFIAYVPRLTRKYFTTIKSSWSHVLVTILNKHFGVEWLIVNFTVSDPVRTYIKMKYIIIWCFLFCKETDIFYPIIIKSSQFYGHPRMLFSNRSEYEKEKFSNHIGSRKLKINFDLNFKY